ncbi:MAG: N-glycosylase/DNA lyase [Candidatus Pacearchaeota archaeon]
MDLINQLKTLRDSSVKEVIDKRIDEFNSFRNKSNRELFSELCFCLLTANFNAEGGIRIQNELNKEFMTLREDLLATRLKLSGHRFPNARARFIVEARKYSNNLNEIFKSLNNDFERRDWLVKNIKGLGYKEASHFLRNVGYNDVAIIDFHIIDLLVKEGLIEKPKNKSLTKNKYLEIENILKKISEKTEMSLGELDLYLWYIETRKVLK